MAEAFELSFETPSGIVLHFPTREKRAPSNAKLNTLLPSSLITKRNLPSFDHTAWRGPSPGSAWIVISGSGFIVAGS